MVCYEFDNIANVFLGIAVAPNPIKLSGSADSTFTMIIQAAENWDITSTAPWLTINNKSGYGASSATVKAIKNPNLLSERNTKIIVSGKKLNVPGIPVTISQSRGGYIILSTDTAYISDDNFHNAYFTVKSNLGWGATSANWLQVSPNSGSGGTQSIYVSANFNLTGNTRMRTLVFGNDYFNPLIADTIVIVQSTTKSKICVGGTLKLSAGLPGTAYQWQVNTGGGFTNVSNNSSLSGTTTNELTFVNIPSSAYGTQYKCLVDGAAGNVYTLQITNYWAGATTAWESAANWSCGNVPDSNTDVINFNGNIVIGSNVTIRSLSISNGASISILPGYNLTILH